MMINSVGSNYQYQNMLNLIRLSGVSQSSPFQAVEPVKRVSSVKSSSSDFKDIQDFLKTYQSKLSKLESSAARISGSSSKNVFNDYQAGVTDESVATASGNYKLNANTDITLNVQSLVQKQQNVSEAHYAQETVEDGADMQFEIVGPDGAKTSVFVGSTNENGTTKTYNDMYQDAAKMINAQSGSGVRASVQNTEGKVSLVISAAQDGAKGRFTINGDAGSAAGIESAAVQGQDAVYTVTENGKTQTLQSDSNRISLDYGRIDAELKGTGETRIYTGVDEDAVISAVEDLVKDYNDVSDFLKTNEKRGSGTSAHLRAFERGMADEKTLNALGITYNKEGKLELDKDTLKSALETDYEGVKSMLGGQFGIAEKAASRADAALSDSVQRIVSNDLTTAVNSQKNDFTSTSFQYFTNFAKNGPYNLTNYYTVGLMLNTLV